MTLNLFLDYINEGKVLKNLMALRVYISDYVLFHLNKNTKTSFMKRLSIYSVKDKGVSEIDVVFMAVILA